jgi:hypothetical protein
MGLAEGFGFDCSHVFRPQPAPCRAAKPAAPLFGAVTPAKHRRLEARQAQGDAGAKRVNEERKAQFARFELRDSDFS